MISILKFRFTFTAAAALLALGILIGVAAALLPQHLTVHMQFAMSVRLSPALETGIPLALLAIGILIAIYFLVRGIIPPRN